MTTRALPRAGASGRCSASPLRADQRNGGFGLPAVSNGGDRKVQRPQQSRAGLGSQPNIVTDLAKLTELLASHPCFFDGAK